MFTEHVKPFMIWEPLFSNIFLTLALCLVQGPVFTISVTGLAWGGVGSRRTAVKNTQNIRTAMQFLQIFLYFPTEKIKA